MSSNICLQSCFELTFKINSIHLKEAENIDEKLSLVIKFANKILRLENSKVKSSSASNEEEMIKKEQISSSRKNVKKTLRKFKSRRGQSLERTRTSFKKQNCEDFDDDDDYSSECSPTCNKETSESSDATSSNGNIFRSIKQHVDSTSSCLSESLSQHCIKYEIYLDDQLIAKASQAINKCFAFSIRNENFDTDIINMRLDLVKPNEDDSGTMDVSITIKKLENRKH
ncbi:CLUMA_CG007844, isoform A [Clunio marinus]|uniref:CLUMA_CG007844, isoform A n=1 Tax=Clunio marinus TaxID=568069 RepID=A0A1J1I7D7_9DIPT|nr:CLUMA_CG007844, isoform A [Clunio marinus]